MCVTNTVVCVQIEKLIKLTDNTYEYDDVITMELVVLRVLNYNVCLSLSFDFLDRFLLLLPPTDEVHMHLLVQMHFAMHVSCLYFAGKNFQNQVFGSISSRSHSS